MYTFWQDIRTGTRGLLRSPVIGVAALLSLIFGIGANAAVFVVVYSALLYPLPFQNPERLVWVATIDGSGNEWVTGPDFLDWRSQARTIERFAAYDQGPYNLSGGDEPERVRGALVTASFFQTLGVQPQLGRTFLPEEDAPGGRPAVILSHGLWQRRFGGRPAVVGQPVLVNGQPRDVIGVMPEGFELPQVDVWMPLALDVAGEQRGTNYSLLNVIVRMRADASLESVRGELDTLFRRTQAANPKLYQATRIHVIPFRDKLVENFSLGLWVAFGAVSFVLLIACANVASLLLAHALRRQQEMAVRFALGASRLRLMRQLVVEHLPLSLASGVAAAVLAMWTVGVVMSAAPASIAERVTIRIDLWVLAFTTVVSLGVGVFFSAMVVLMVARGRFGDRLSEARTTPLALGFQRFLVSIECALALMLLVGATLLVRSFVALQDVDPGYRSDRLVSAAVNLSGPKYAQPAQRAQFFERILTDLRNAPGITHVAAADSLPLQPATMRGTLQVEGAATPTNSKTPVTISSVSEGFFHAIGVPLREGRDFTPRDIRETERVAIINQAAARTFFGEEPAVGKRIRLAFLPMPLTIVGTTGDVRQFGLDQAVAPQVYLPYRQNLLVRSLNLVVTTSTPLDAIAPMLRARVYAIDRDQPLGQVTMVDMLLSESVAPRRFAMFIAGAFGLIGLVLAAVGVYGVVSFQVSQRTREIGIRMSIGAQPRDVQRLVLREGLILAAIGSTLGLLGAFGVGRVLSSLLYAVKPLDVATFVSVPLLLVAIGTLATYLPARRASRVNATDALRHQ
jgi:predicted permease